jgi:hypothetical protein
VILGLSLYNDINLQAQKNLEASRGFFFCMFTDKKPKGRFKIIIAGCDLCVVRSCYNLVERCIDP